MNNVEKVVCDSLSSIVGVTGVATTLDRRPRLRVTVKVTDLRRDLSHRITELGERLQSVYSDYLIELDVVWE